MIEDMVQLPAALIALEEGMQWYDWIILAIVLIVVIRFFAWTQDDQ